MPAPHEHTSVPTGNAYAPHGHTSIPHEDTLVPHEHTSVPHGHPYAQKCFIYIDICIMLNVTD